MAVVTIFTYRDRNVVWPPCVVLKPGEEVVFKSVNTAATVFLPRPELFAVASGATATAAAASAAPGITLSLSGNAGGARIKIKGQPYAVGGGSAPGNPAPGVYPYAVYCKNANDFAEGNSSPVMIIEPPDPVVPIWDGSQISQ